MAFQTAVTHAASRAEEWSASQAPIRLRAKNDGQTATSLSVQIRPLHAGELARLSCCKSKQFTGEGPTQSGTKVNENAISQG